MKWMEWLQGISLVIASWTAIYGISAWRREHVGARRVELAEDTLALFYEAADVIRHIRHPASFGYETSHIEQEENETEEAFAARKNASIVFVRFEKRQELFNRIYAARYRFMAQFGKHNAGPFDELHAIKGEIFTAARMLVRLWNRQHFRTQEQLEQHDERVTKFEAVFWEGNEEDDPINPRVRRMIMEIEAVCRREIESFQTSLWRRVLDKLPQKVRMRKAASP